MKRETGNGSQILKKEMRKHSCSWIPVQASRTETTNLDACTQVRWFNDPHKPDVEDIVSLSTCCQIRSPDGVPASQHPCKLYFDLDFIQFNSPLELKSPSLQTSAASVTTFSSQTESVCTSGCTDCVEHEISCNIKREGEKSLHELIPEPGSTSYIKSSDTQLSSTEKGSEVVEAGGERDVNPCFSSSDVSSSTSSPPLPLITCFFFSDPERDEEKECEESNKIPAGTRSRRRRSGVELQQEMHDAGDRMKQEKKLGKESGKREIELHKISILSEAKNIELYQSRIREREKKEEHRHPNHSPLRRVSRSKDVVHQQHHDESGEGEEEEGVSGLLSVSRGRKDEDEGEDRDNSCSESFSTHWDAETRRRTNVRQENEQTDPQDRISEDGIRQEPRLQNMKQTGKKSNESCCKVRQMDSLERDDEYVMSSRGELIEDASEDRDGCFEDQSENQQELYMYRSCIEIEKGKSLKRFRITLIPRQASTTSSLWIYAILIEIRSPFLRLPAPASPITLSSSSSPFCTASPIPSSFLPSFLFHAAAAVAPGSTLNAFNSSLTSATAAAGSEFAAANASSLLLLRKSFLESMLQNSSLSTVCKQMQQEPKVKKKEQQKQSQDLFAPEPAKFIRRQAAFTAPSHVVPSSFSLDDDDAATTSAVVTASSSSQLPNLHIRECDRQQHHCTQPTHTNSCYCSCTHMINELRDSLNHRFDQLFSRLDQMDDRIRLIADHVLTEKESAPNVNDSSNR